MVIVEYNQEGAESIRSRADKIYLKFHKYRKIFEGFGLRILKFSKYTKSLLGKIEDHRNTSPDWRQLLSISLG